MTVPGDASRASKPPGTQPDARTHPPVGSHQDTHQTYPGRKRHSGEKHYGENTNYHEITLKMKRKIHPKLFLILWS